MHREKVVVVVGVVVDQDGVLLAVVRTVDVGGQLDAVAHRDHDVAFDDDVVGHVLLPSSGLLIFLVGGLPLAGSAGVAVYHRIGSAPRPRILGPRA